MRIRELGLVSLALFLGSCSQAERPANESRPQQPQQFVQRFVHIPREANPLGIPWSGAFALDTKTGLLCKTYSLDNETWAQLPGCLDLYTKYP